MLAINVSIPNLMITQSCAVFWQSLATSFMRFYLTKVSMIRNQI